MAEEIEDGFAREQAGLLSSLVEHVRLRITLEFGHTVADTADMRDVLGGLDLPTAQTVAEVESRSGTAVPIDELRAENIALRGVLADTMDALEGAVNADEAGDRHLKEVRALLRRQLARWMLALGILASLAANVAQGWSHGLGGTVVAAWPAASLVGSYELLA
jgi:hypothetical protein